MTHVKHEQKQVKGKSFEVKVLRDPLQGLISQDGKDNVEIVEWNTLSNYLEKWNHSVGIRTKSCFKNIKLF